MKKLKTVLIAFIVLLVIGAFAGNKNKTTNSVTTTSKIETTSRSLSSEKESNKTTRPVYTSTPSPEPTPEPTAIPSLKKGNKGDDVSVLQSYLSRYGYLTGTTTGNYDNKTVSAVKDFQINNNLTETGICDEETWKKLTSGRPVVQAIVYKSKKGKVYHSYDSCSGMKTATEMTLSDALRKGLTPCSHCH